jgi:hypothetical protein
MDAVTSFFSTAYHDLLWDICVKKSYFDGEEKIVGLEWKRRRIPLGLGSATPKSRVPGDIEVATAVFFLAPVVVLFASLAALLALPYLICRLAYEAYKKVSPGLRKAYTWLRAKLSRKQ